MSPTIDFVATAWPYCVRYARGYDVVSLFSGKSSFPGRSITRRGVQKKKTKKIIINKHGKKNKSLPTRADTVRRVYKKCKKLIKQRFDVVDPAPPPTFNPGRWKPRDSVAAAVQYVFFRCCIVQYCFYTADSFWHLNAPTRRRFKTALSAKTAVHESIRHRVV